MQQLQVIKNSRKVDETMNQNKQKEQHTGHYFDPRVLENYSTRVYLNKKIREREALESISSM